MLDRPLGCSVGTRVRTGVERRQDSADLTRLVSGGRRQTQQDGLVHALGVGDGDAATVEQIVQARMRTRPYGDAERRATGDEPGTGGLERWGEVAVEDEAELHQLVGVDLCLEIGIGGDEQVRLPAAESSGGRLAAVAHSDSTVGAATIVYRHEELPGCGRRPERRNVGITRGGGSFSPAPRLVSPSVSVVVPTFRGAQPVRECLDSLVAQTAAHDRFEVVVVHLGNEAEIPTLVGDLRAEHPHLNVRVVEARGPHEGQARNVGIAAAGGDYLTVVDAGDRVGAGYLEAMLEEADPGIVVVAMIDELGVRGSTDPALRRVAGRTLLASEMPALFGAHTGTLVSTELARSALVDPALGSGANHAYWLSLFAQRQFRFRVLRADDAATYHRMKRPSSSAGVDGSLDVVRRLECMRALESVPRVDPSVSRVAWAVAEDLAAGINSYLRAHPAERAGVVARAETMGVREVPWSQVNTGLARDLAICYCFPPDNDTSGLVAAKRIRGRGVVTDVVSHDLSWIRDVDRQSLRVPGEFLGRHHVVQGTASFTGWTHLSRFAKEAVATVGQWEAEQGPYATMYSRAMAISSHYAAAVVKVRRPEIRWTAEFSDPMRFNILGEERPDEVAWDWLSRELADAMRAAGHEPVLRADGALRLFEWAERLVYALADEITFTNDQQRRLMIEHCDDPVLAQRAMEISQVDAHPVLPRPFYELTPVDLGRTSDQVQLAYFGAFYQTRHLGDLVQALLRLRQDERERLRLRVYTPDPPRLKLELARLGLTGTVTAHPYRPVLEFLNLTTHFDVLVLDDARTTGSHDVNPYLPSKLSDYRGSGTPIWAIAEPGSVMSSLQFEYESTLGDVDQAVAVLRGLIRERVSS